MDIILGIIFGTLIIGLITWAVMCLSVIIIMDIKYPKMHYLSSKKNVFGLYLRTNKEYQKIEDKRDKTIKLLQIPAYITGFIIALILFI